MVFLNVESKIEMHGFMTYLATKIKTFQSISNAYSNNTQYVLQLSFLVNDYVDIFKKRLLKNKLKFSFFFYINSSNAMHI